MKKKFAIPRIEVFGIDVIKNMFLFVLFVFMFLLTLGIMVAPSVKKFKKVKKEYYITKMKLDDSNTKVENMLIEYKKLYKENRKIIFSFKREFNKQNFINFAQKYMKIYNLKDLNVSNYKKDFIQKSFLVTADLTTPVNFYKFVNATKNYKNVLRIHFPIVFKAKDGNIKLIYKLEYFQVKDKNRTELLD